MNRPIQLHRIPGDDQADVVVVGARCAGAATAMLLADRGYDVVVVDRAAFPSDTLSTHAIARTGVVQLHRWGLLDAVLASGAPGIQEVVFHAAGGELRRTFKDRYGVDVLVAPRRHVLDPILQAAAVDRGARLRTGVTIRGVCRSGDGRTTGVHGRDANGAPVTIRARLVVGADGLRSRIARSVGAGLRLEGPSGGATHYAYAAGDWPAMEYHLGGAAFAGAFPTHDGQACIWVCSPSAWALEHRVRADTIDQAFTRMLEEAAPQLAARLDPAAWRSPARGMVGMPNQIRRSSGPGWALVGDAGLHRDAITGHGISDAFRDAELLADAADLALSGAMDEATALARYEHERDAMAREVFEITCEMAAFPPAERFTELQKRLSLAIDVQAGALAARPSPMALAA